MNSEAVKEVLDVLFSHLEKLETQTEAIFEYLKEKQNVTDEQLAPYLEKAANGSYVRWLAARVRVKYLLQEAQTNEGDQGEKKAETAAKASDSATVVGAQAPATNEQKSPEAEKSSEVANGEPDDSRSPQVAKETNTPTESKPEVLDQSKKDTSDSGSPEKTSDQEAA